MIHLLISVSCTLIFKVLLSGCTSCIIYLYHLTCKSQTKIQIVPVLSAHWHKYPYFHSVSTIRLIHSDIAPQNHLFRLVATDTGRTEHLDANHLLPSTLNE